MLIVHGVGPFDSREMVERDVFDQLEANGVLADQVTAFDWPMLVGDQADKVPQVGRAVFRLVHLRLPPSACRVPRIWENVRLQVYGTLQFLFILVPVVSLIGVFEHVALEVWAASAGISSAVALLSERLVSGPQALARFVRQLALLAGWPIVHSAMLASYSHPERIFMWPAGIFSLFAFLAQHNKFPQ